MNKYTCNGFNAVEADSMSAAAEIFATRAARRKYGRTAECVTCNQGAHAADMSMAEYSAFIGYRVDPGGWNGNDINFSVYVERDIQSAAAVLGRKGGSVKSAAKAAAVRENGKKGGRPRKVKPAPAQ